MHGFAGILGRAGRESRGSGISCLRVMTQKHTRRRVIWNRGGQPVPYASEKLELQEEDVSAAIHAIKAAARLRGADSIIMDDTGNVTDSRGEEIGNIYDED